jgi:hypothetical protein
MHRRLIAALGTALILLAALIWSRGDRPAERPTKAKLPKALGAIQPRLSPDGSTVQALPRETLFVTPRAALSRELRPSTTANPFAERTFDQEGPRIASAAHRMFVFFQGRQT